MQGIVIATKTTDTDHLQAMLRIGGISILERQIRIMRKLGIRNVLVLTAKDDDELKVELNKLDNLKMNLKLVFPDKEGFGEFQDISADKKNDQCLLMDGASLFDERLARTTMEKPETGEYLAVLKRSDVASNDWSSALSLKVDGQEYAFAGCARLKADRVSEMKPLTGNEWLGSYLSDIAIANKETLFDIRNVPLYSYELRRDEPILWLPIKGASDNHRGKKALLNAAQKSVLDWPAWYIHRPIEKWIIYHLCETSITPNQITVINNIVAFLGAYFFAIGWITSAMICALAVGVIDGLDGKQARTKLMYSKLGEMEEVLDKIYENTWYLAMAYYLSNLGGLNTTLPYILFFIIFVMNMADIVIGLISRQKLGIQLDDAGNFERIFRQFSGRRNTYIWTMIPFLIFWSFYAGYWMITFYAIITVLVRTWRLKVRLQKAGKSLF